MLLVVKTFIACASGLVPEPPALYGTDDFITELFCQFDGALPMSTNIHRPAEVRQWRNSVFSVYLAVRGGDFCDLGRFDRKGSQQRLVEDE
jgi:hypothetical protein